MDVIESIIGPNITGAHSMLINKPPDADPGASLHPLHQVPTIHHSFISNFSLKIISGPSLLSF